MTATQTEIIGKNERILKALEEHDETFTNGNLNVEAMQANLSGLNEQLLAADAHQEALKAQTRASARTGAARCAPIPGMPGSARRLARFTSSGCSTAVIERCPWSVTFTSTNLPRGSS